MTVLADALSHLAESLPAWSEASVGDDQSRRARATLQLLTSPASGALHHLETDLTGCPNCRQPVSSPRSPYCSCECREEAGFVRQMRAGLLEGTIFDEERQVALGQKLWRLLGGGLPLRLSLIPSKAWEKFLTKYPACEACGAPATTIDNIGGG